MNGPLEIMNTSCSSIGPPLTVLKLLHDSSMQTSAKFPTVQHRNGKMSNNHSTATVTIKQNVVIGVPSTTITNGANTEKLVKTNHELVVVRSNGQVTVDLIERSPELT